MGAVVVDDSSRDGSVGKLPFTVHLDRRLRALPTRQVVELQTDDCPDTHGSTYEAASGKDLRSQPWHCAQGLTLQDLTRGGFLGLVGPVAGLDDLAEDLGLLAGDRVEVLGLHSDRGVEGVSVFLKHPDSAQGDHQRDDNGECVAVDHDRPLSLV